MRNADLDCRQRDIKVHNETGCRTWSHRRILSDGVFRKDGSYSHNSHFSFLDPTENEPLLKHSRIASTLDFGEKWYRQSCSRIYWDEVKPIFDRLEKLHDEGADWSDLSQDDKWNNVYVPLLTAFRDEILRQKEEHYDLPRRMVEYLLGQFDFYKVISLDAREVTQFQTFNLRSTLNQASSEREPDVMIDTARLPKNILHFDFKRGSKTTLEMCLDEGWYFTFRLHNGDGRVIPSLKFDVQIKGMPSEIRVIDVAWLR